MQLLKDKEEVQHAINIVFNNLDNLSSDKLAGFMCFLVKGG